MLSMKVNGKVNYRKYLSLLKLKILNIRLFTNFTFTQGFILLLILIILILKALYKALYFYSKHSKQSKAVLKVKLKASNKRPVY